MDAKAKANYAMNLVRSIELYEENEKKAQTMLYFKEQYKEKAAFEVAFHVYDSERGTQAGRGVAYIVTEEFFQKVFDLVSHEILFDNEAIANELNGLFKAGDAPVLSPPPSKSEKAQDDGEEI